MGHFSDQFLTDCDRRTSDDDYLDRRDGVSSKPVAPAPIAYEKSIEYCRDTKDYKMTLDGRPVGFRATYSQAEYALDDMVYEMLIDGDFHTAEELDGDPPAPPPDPDPLPDPGPEGPGVPGDERPYTRDSAFDKHILFGDDYAGDAWRDQFGLLRWVAVGIDPNTRA